jgi:hypothetical protein
VPSTTLHAHQTHDQPRTHVHIHQRTVACFNSARVTACASLQSITYQTCLQYTCSLTTQQSLSPLIQQLLTDAIVLLLYALQFRHQCAQVVDRLLRLLFRCLRSCTTSHVTRHHIALTADLLFGCKLVGQHVVALLQIGELDLQLGTRLSNMRSPITHFTPPPHPHPLPLTCRSCLMSLANASFSCSINYTQHQSFKSILNAATLTL